MQLEIQNVYQRLHDEEREAMKDIEAIIGVPIAQYRFTYEDGFGFPMMPFGFTEEKGHVIKLGLSEQNLTFIPEAIRKLPKLTTLKINTNQIREIPDWFDLCTHINSLNIGQNQIEQVEYEGNWWKHLRALNFEGNRLIEIPIGLKNAKELIVSTFANNQIRDVPDWFGSLTSLNVLSFRKNQLCTLPHSMQKIKSLMQLVLAHNEFREIPEIIGMLTNLHVLDLSYNNLSQLPSNLHNLHKLEQLHLENNNFQTLPWIIGSLPRLEHLFLSNNPWIGKSKEITEQIAYEIPKGHWIAVDYLHKEYPRWNPEYLLEKVRENQEIDEFDYSHPRLTHYIPLIEEKCNQINNSAAKRLLNIIASIQKNQLQSTKILL
jgi:ribulose bisphosphate carboxylase small subunit